LSFVGAGKGEDFLAYLADIGLVLPRWTIDLSDDVARHLEVIRHPEFISEKHSISSDVVLCDSTWGLLNEIESWEDPIFDDWLTPHPLDQRPVPENPFLFSGWRPSRKIVIGASDGHPLLGSATTHYYATWQMFQMAFLSDGFARVIFDPIRYRPSQRVEDGPLDGMIAASPSVNINWRNVVMCEAISERQALFDLVSAFRSRSNRERRRWKIVASGKRVAADEWHQASVREIQVAKQELTSRNLSSDDLVEFIKWLCDVWGQIARKTTSCLESEVRHFIMRAVQIWRLATGREWEELVNIVGRVTGHFKPTLKVIFPDWVEDQKEHAARSILTSMRRLQPLCAVNMSVNQDEARQMIDWLDSKGLTTIYWIHKGLIDARFDSDLDFSSGYLTYLQALALYIEHMLAAFAPKSKKLGKGYSGRMKSLWSGTSILQSAPNKDTPTGGQSILIELPKLDAACEKYSIDKASQTLLRALLCRNLAAHGGFKSLPEEWAISLSTDLFDAMTLTWFRAREVGWT